MNEPVQIFVVDCCICNFPQNITAPLSDKEPPTDVVCPHCLQGLAALHRNENIESIRIAEIRFPGDASLWLTVWNEDFDHSAFGRILHGDIFESDQIRASDESDENETELQGKLDRRIRQGIEDFEITREFLKEGHPAKAVFEHMLDLAAKRLQHEPK